MIGSRDVCPYGLEVTSSVASYLSAEHTLVSGLAKGIDACVHETAILCGGKTIGVIGSGLRWVYPRSNLRLYQKMKRDHLILSEYPFEEGVRREHFPWRNRILAALGSRTIVTQAAVRSGTMHTVNEALNLGREVWCVPYPYGSEYGSGSNLLIQQGANILYDREQLKHFLYC